MNALEEQLDRDPHDEAAFLVYADALLERGNPHGELIRVQHALAHRPDDDELQVRDIALRRQVLAGMETFGASNWQLGFPRALQLFWVGDENFGALSMMLRSRLFRFIEAVTLSDYVSGERVVELLEGLPHLVEVAINHNLEVYSSRNVSRLLEALGRLAGLRRLSLSTHQATVLLSEVPVFRRLEQLTLKGTRLLPEDVPVLARARGLFAPGCVLRLEGGTCSLAVEQLVAAAWPFATEELHQPGLLVEAPAVHRGCWLLSSAGEKRIGHHLACDLWLTSSGLRAVHSVFAGDTLREAGDLSNAPKRLSDGEVVQLGDATLRYCADVAERRAAMRRGD